MNKLKFKNGDEMAAIGLGTWKAKPKLVETAVKYALNNGYRHIDGAKNYANEKALGNAFQTVFSEGKIKRKDIWITSKLWNNSHRKDEVLPALQKTLSDLQLDYLDLYLMHWPVAFKNEIDNFPQKDEDYLSLEEVPLAETWEAMLKAKEEGLIRHAGVSNFSIQKLEALKAATGEFPEMLQVECHPYLPQNELLEFCKKNGIHFTAYSPLGSGDRHPSMKANDEPVLLEDKVILSIAEKHNCNPGQVLIKWQEDRGIAVIPKSTSERHIKMNLAAAELNLDKEDKKAIAQIGKQYRYVDGEFFVTPGNPYENIFDL